MEDFKLKEKHDLYNEDLRPFTIKDRTINSFTLGTTWFGMSIQLAIFLIAAQLTSSLSLFQVALALLLGLILCWIISILISDIGIKYGISFASSVKIPFGYKGGHFASLVRSLPSLFWGGFNIWLAGSALNEVFKLSIGFDSLPFSMGIIAVLTALLIFKGIKILALFNWFVSPVLLIMGFYLLYLILSLNDVSLSTAMSMGEAGGGFREIAFGAMAIAGGWIMVVVSFNDITRECKVNERDLKSWGKTNNKYAIAQLIGFIPGTLLFGFIGAMSMVLTGNANPAEVITQTVGQNSPGLAILFQLFIVLALLSTNSGANILGPAYAITSMFTKKMNLKIASVLIIILALLIQPWNYIDSIEDVLGVISGSLAPIAGIIIVDYYFIRKRTINLDELFSSNGKYKYVNGINPVAFASYALGVIASLFAWDFMLVIGLIVSGITYYLLTKLRTAKKFE